MTGIFPWPNRIKHRGLRITALLTFSSTQDISSSDRTTSLDCFLLLCGNAANTRSPQSCKTTEAGLFACNCHQCFCIFSHFLKIKFEDKAASTSAGSHLRSAQEAQPTISIMPCDATNNYSTLHFTSNHLASEQQIERNKENVLMRMKQ